MAQTRAAGITQFGFVTDPRGRPFNGRLANASGSVQSLVALAAVRRRELPLETLHRIRTSRTAPRQPRLPCLFGDHCGRFHLCRYGNISFRRGFTRSRAFLRGCRLFASRCARYRRCTALNRAPLHSYRLTGDFLCSLAFHGSLFPNSRFRTGSLLAFIPIDKEPGAVFYIPDPGRRPAASAPSGARFRIGVFRRNGLHFFPCGFRHAISDLDRRLATALFPNERLDVGKTQSMLVHQITDPFETDRSLLFGDCRCLLLKLCDLQLNCVQCNHFSVPVRITRPGGRPDFPHPVETRHGASVRYPIPFGIIASKQ